MIPVRHALAPLVLPAPAPVPELVASIHPPAHTSAHHVAGEARGGRLYYADLWAFVWWKGGGRELRGPRVMFGRRGLSGREDNAKRKQ